ncbi:hypothetical protein GH714_032096 [Hevea brasiliensis]|uniref:Uncharacterized protein n=1 Tax=Hevea brasiliensis TaxID=3981 RepID=A0A6A6N486_HEVBR|nr:hypothetical protein GH714_032096 [Hevea brasiliensis]
MGAPVWEHGRTHDTRVNNENVPKQGKPGNGIEGRKELLLNNLSSTKTSHVKNKIHEELDSGKPSMRLLNVTPELTAIPGFMAKLTRIHARGFLNLIAIDEV